MKQRITYLVRDTQGGVDPASLGVGSDSLKIPGIDAAKEWRITVGVKELPREIREVLEQSHELHIRWASDKNYRAVPPLVSRTAPGLHVFYTPRNDATVDNLCSIMMNEVFGDNLSCHGVKESFSSSPILSERFSMSAAFQYHQPLSSLAELVHYIQQSVCSPSNKVCRDQISALEHASTVDFDFDAISHALKVTAVWANAPGGGLWSETIRLHSSSDSIEVGILNAEKATEPEELSLGGFLTVLGEDGKPSPTLFSFPSRHHPLPPSSLTTYTTSFKQPTGLHPTLSLNFPASSLTPPSDSCSLHAYLTLPKTLFIDRYQLSDPLFLSSQHLTALHSLSGETDLEAPTWVVKRWGSAALLELAVPDEDAVNEEPWTVNVPLHLRYLEPLNATAEGGDAGHRNVEVSWPAVFWACEAEEGLKMSVNPFDRVNLGYDGLFGPKTMFYHVPPAEGARLVEEVKVPVMDLEKSGWVEMGTTIVVALGFAWVCYKLISGWRGEKKVDAGKKRARRG